MLESDWISNDESLILPAFYRISIGVIEKQQGAVIG